MSALSAEFLPEITPVWTCLPELVVPDAPVAAACVGVCIDGMPAMVLRLGDSGSGSPFSSIHCAGNIVFVGLGCSLYVAIQQTRTLYRHAMEGYFGAFHALDDFEAIDSTPAIFLACSASRLHRFSADGELLWTSPRLGIDGVVVHRIIRNEIHGAGEWDPPGGWVDFIVDAQSGRTSGADA
jgi:hypothetical protein